MSDPHRPDTPQEILQHIIYLREQKFKSQDDQEKKQLQGLIDEAEAEFKKVEDQFRIPVYSVAGPSPRTSGGGSGFLDGLVVGACFFD